MKLKYKLIIMSVLPVFVLGISIYFVASAKIKEGIYQQAYNGMHATTLAIRNIFETNHPGEYYLDDHNEMWKGEALNISQANDIVDQIKSNTDMEVTVFFNDTRYLTTIIDENGKRQIGTQALPVVTETVLNHGEEYHADNVDILGTKYIVYYIPLYQEGTQNPVGMIFLGTKQSEVNSIILDMKLDLLTILCLAILLIAFIATIIVRRIVNYLNASITSVKTIAAGNLNAHINDKYRSRNDEVGDLCKSVDELSTKLSGMISSIKKNSDYLLNSSHKLDKTAKNASTSIEQVDFVVQEIATGSSHQAISTEEAAKDVAQMGNMISETMAIITELNNTTIRMNSASTQAKDTLSKLNQSMTDVVEVINSISNQTTKTNESVIKISEAARLITAIAGQTNLLALNASIEASRAGDQGKGFGVVANEIKRLSEQSNKSAAQIQVMLEQLTNDSNHAVNLMQDVRDSIGIQKDNLSLTVDAFQTVTIGIEESVEGIHTISDKTILLNESRSKTIEVVENLTTIAEENAAGTQEAAASVEEVRNLVAEVAEHAFSLNDIAEDLKASMDVFQL